MKKYKIQQILEHSIKRLLQLVAVAFILLVIWGITKLFSTDVLEMLGFLAALPIAANFLWKRKQKEPKELEYDRYFAYRDKKPIDKNIQQLIDEMGEKEE